MNIRCSTSDEVWQTVTAALEKQRWGGGFSLADDAGKPAAIITSERHHDLWQAVMARCDELKQQHKPNHGHSQSSALADWDGRGVSGILGVGQGDGTDLVYRIHARTTGRPESISVGHDGPWLDSHDAFWAQQLADRSTAVVINHEHYRVRPDSGRPGPGDGFDGQMFRIRWLADGSVTETRNLWHQGIIPPSWRDRLPDNAEFVKAGTSEPNPYEHACERFNVAGPALAMAMAEAERIVREADAEYEAARANLRRYETSPGIPLPECRELAQAAGTEQKS